MARPRKPVPEADKPRFFVPPAAKADKKSSSGDSGGTKTRFYQRKEPLPTDTIWRGTADRMPYGYTKDKQWNCPSCDVEPGKQHEQWCPRYLYQLNPYNAAAYDNELFLADFFETQIWFGDGHPVVSSSVVRERDVGDILLEKAGLKKSNPNKKETQKLPGSDTDLPF